MITHHLLFVFVVFSLPSPPETKRGRKGDSMTWPRQRMPPSRRTWIHRSNRGGTTWWPIKAAELNYSKSSLTLCFDRIVSILFSLFMKHPARFGRQGEDGFTCIRGGGKRQIGAKIEWQVGSAACGVGTTTDMSEAHSSSRLEGEGDNQLPSRGLSFVGWGNRLTLELGPK
jgi:hypothetical protein